MSEVINIYCDESCHLEHDFQKVMVLGAIWNPQEKSREIALNLKRIKEESGLKRNFECKWVKVSKGRLDYYSSLLEYFFSNPDLHFRAVVIPDKSILRHSDFHQSHDDWYYKMYFELLRIIIQKTNKYRIFLDIKDTRSQQKVIKLQEVLCKSKMDFENRIVERIQSVRSEEVEQIQLTDFLTGLTAYVNRGLTTSEAKNSLVELCKKRSNLSLIESVTLSNQKFNLLIWRPRENE